MKITKGEPIDFLTRLLSLKLASINEVYDSE
jgi:hypothetical protein